MTIERTPKRLTDHSGRAIVEVPLANWPHPARLYADDYDRLAALGFGKGWTFNPNERGDQYVRASCTLISGDLATVARLIMGAGEGKIVRYKNGNRLDLRRDNLKNVGGRGGSREAGALLIAGARAAVMARQKIQRQALAA